MSIHSQRPYFFLLKYYRISSIPAAPASCLQYHTGSSGTLKSFNYAGGAYTNELAYNTCIARVENACLAVLWADAGHFGLQKLNSLSVPADRLVMTYILVISLRSYYCFIFYLKIIFNYRKAPK